MPGRLLSTSFLASAAVAVLAHAGAITGLILLTPAGEAGQQVGEEDFEITLVELAEGELLADMAEPEPDAPVPEPPQLAPDPVPQASPDPELQVETVAPEPAPDLLPASDMSSDPEADNPAPAATTEPVQPLSEEVADIAIPDAAVSVPSASASSSSAPASPVSEGEIDLTAYWRAVQQQLARHAPRGVRGARDCEVEFRLSGEGEVVFVGIRTSSGIPLYDRRCLRAVTHAAPFPAAPPGTAPEDLSFTIVMLQRR